MDIRDGAPARGHMLEFSIINHTIQWRGPACFARADPGNRTNRLSIRKDGW